MRQEKHWVLFWGLVVLAQTALLAAIYKDSYQQDGGNHFLHARWAWVHPDYFIGVWSRPLFTLLYSIPSQLGYFAAKAFTGAVTAVTAVQAYRIAKLLGMNRSWAVIPLYFLQSSVFLLSFDTLTEPLFALVLTLALRFHVERKDAAAILLVSFLPTARPEGFFIVLFWGLMVVFDRSQSWERSIRRSALLGIGTLLWCGAGLLIAGDFLYPLHAWPRNWGLESPYGSGPITTFLVLAVEIFGPVIGVMAAFGAFRMLFARRWLFPGLWFTIFAVHTLLWWRGWFGSAGYPRYFVTVAPCAALVALEGWNRLGGLLGRWARPLAISAIGISWIYNLAYVDCHRWGRDFVAFEDACSRVRDEPPGPMRRLIASQAYPYIYFDRDPREMPAFTGAGQGPPERRRNLELLGACGSGTLAVWDAETGPGWYTLTAEDFLAGGFHRVGPAREYGLEGFLFKGLLCAPRRQKIEIFYKP